MKPTGRDGAKQGGKEAAANASSAGKMPAGESRPAAGTLAPGAQDGAAELPPIVSPQVASRRVQRLLDHPDAGVAISDPHLPDHPLVFVNDAFTRMTGYGAEEVIGRNARFLHGANTDPSSLLAMREAIEARQPLSIDLQQYRKDGTDLLSRLTMMPQFGDNGEIESFVYFLQDLSSQGHLQRELGLRERALRKVQELANIGFWEHDRSTGVFLATDRVYEIAGVALDDARRTFAAVLEHVHVDDRPFVQEWVTGTGVARPDEVGGDGIVFRLVRPDGSLCHLYAERLESTPERHSGLVQDITLRATHEAELRVAHARAEFASQVKSRFIAQMSHELRTPLNAILGFVELLLDDGGEPVTNSQRAYLNDIQDAARLLRDLVVDILDMAKLDAGAVQLNLQLIDVPHLLERCGRTLVLKARSRGVELAWNAHGVGTLFADELRVRQVLLNLVGNAIKFTPRGGTVEIHAEQMQSGVRLTVADTGVGMSDDGIRRALEPFVQLDDGLDRQHEGAGLGLPIANRLVDLHGGTMTMESRPGHGTRVIVELPSPNPPRPGDIAPPPLSKTG